MAISIFHQCQVRSWPFAGTHRFLAGLFTFLSRQPTVNGAEPVEGTGVELSSKVRKKLVRVFCSVFLDMMLSYKMWLVLCENEWQETGNVAGNWLRQ